MPHRLYLPRSVQIQHDRDTEEIPLGLEIDDAVIAGNDVLDRLRPVAGAGMLHGAEPPPPVLLGRCLIGVVDGHGQGALGRLAPHLDPALPGCLTLAGLHGVLQQIAEQDAEVRLGDLDVLRDADADVILDICLLGLYGKEGQDGVDRHIAAVGKGALDHWPWPPGSGYGGAGRGGPGGPGRYAG